MLCLMALIALTVSNADTAALENDYVRVMCNTTACPQAHTPGYGTRVIVALAHMEIAGSGGTRSLERGGIAVFPARKSYTSPRGEYFQVAFKSDHPPYTAPEQWLEPVKNTIVYEDDQLRVFEERLAGGDTRELHSHAQRVVVRLNDVQLTDPRFNPVPKPGTGIQVPNTVRFAEPMVHVVHNVSAAPLFNIVIECKPQAGRELVYSDAEQGEGRKWIAELEQPSASSMSWERGTLDIDAAAGATVWFAEQLSGDLMITYDAVQEIQSHRRKASPPRIHRRAAPPPGKHDIRDNGDRGRRPYATLQERRTVFRSHRSDTAHTRIFRIQDDTKPPADP